MTSRLPPTVEWTGTTIRIIDQRQLPFELVMADLDTVEAVADAIRDMAVRGAPAIGCVAALGVALAAHGARDLPLDRALDALRQSCEALRQTRPTAVNLFHGLNCVWEAASDARDAEEAASRALTAALQLLSDDVAANRAIGAAGAALLPERCRVLTHCNAGALATAGYGTALGVVRAAFETGRLQEVYADETRPRLQGMQLTAWELMQDGIPVTVIPDGAAAALMAAGRVDAVVVGADRIAANGDTANKIGTYGLAIVARHHGVPLYVAAPTTTIDWDIQDGSRIPIEERSGREITEICGTRVAPDGAVVWNPAFDVTPAMLISAIITERGVVEGPTCERMERLRRG